MDVGAHHRFEGLRQAIGLLTVIPVRGGGSIDRHSAGQAMIWAPAVGAILALAGAVVGLLGEASGLGGWLVAVLALGSLAVLTRGLHLDGLADTADALGSARPAQAALGIMKASDIGPFGVICLIFTLLIQVAALAQTWAAGYGPATLVIAAATGRLAATWACRPGVPAARPDGLGALVAGTVPPPGLRIATALTLAGAVCLGALHGYPIAPGSGLGGLLTPPVPARFPPGAPVLVEPLFGLEPGLVLRAVLSAVFGAARAALAVGAGLLAALALRRLAVRRLGGITGDVLGALVETATTVALVVLTATLAG